MSSYTTTMKHADKALQPKELQLKKFDKLTPTSCRCLSLALRTIWDWWRLYFQKHSQPANISQRSWTNIYMSRGHVVSPVRDKSFSIWLQDKLHIHTTSGNKHLQKDWEQPVDVLPVVRQVQRHSATNSRLTERSIRGPNGERKIVDNLEEQHLPTYDFCRFEKNKRTRNDVFPKLGNKTKKRKKQPTKTHTHT